VGVMGLYSFNIFFNRFWRFLFNARISHISHLDGTVRGRGGREIGAVAGGGQSFYRFAA